MPFETCRLLPLCHCSPIPKATIVSNTPYAVIAYTAMLTANFVLSSRWKRLLRQS